MPRKKKTPIDQAHKSRWGAEKKDVEKSELQCSRQGLTNANPMPIKRKPPPTSPATKANGGHS